MRRAPITPEQYEEQAGKLYTMQEKGITIALEPIEPPKMAEAA